MTDWIEIAVSADHEAVESVAELLRQYGQGVAIEEPFIQPRLDEAPERDPTLRAIVKTYILDGPGAAATQECIEESLWHLSQLRAIDPVETRLVPEEDWANAWKPFFPVLHLAQRTVIVPMWRRYRARPEDIIVRLDPGMAFGTGMHPTTRLCLEAIEQLVQPGMSVLDVGTGSGILSIASARLGALSVVGVDTDPVAVSAARSNVRRNRLARVISIYEGSVDSSLSDHQTPFDLVLANVTARVNAELANAIANLLRPGGLLVASGILSDNASSVRDAFAAVGLAVLEERPDGDWVALIARRGP